jgi:hypothetical protein
MKIVLFKSWPYKSQKTEKHTWCAKNCHESKIGFVLSLKEKHENCNHCLTTILLYRSSRDYYYQQYSSSLLGIFNGVSTKLSTKDIYNIDYNSTIPQLGTTAGIDIVEAFVDYVFGLDGERRFASKKLLDLPILSSSNELCFSFNFLQEKGAKYYKMNFKIFAEVRSAPMIKLYVSLPNHARSFDRFDLSKLISLRDNFTTVVELSVTSLKILEKRNTVVEPCAVTGNYDKVSL